MKISIWREVLFREEVGAPNHKYQRGDQKKTGEQYCYFVLRWAFRIVNRSCGLS